MSWGQMNVKLKFALKVKAVGKSKYKSCQGLGQSKIEFKIEIQINVKFKLEVKVKVTFEWKSKWKPNVVNLASNVKIIVKEY